MAKVKEDPAKLLSDTPQEYVFWCNDGRILKNLNDLGQALAGMTDETFSFHSNVEKNDFANWVRDIIGDSKLTTALQRASEDRTQAAKAVAKRLAELEKKRR
ncbi:MAG: hypothetical protein HYX79_10315 [Chloroflexi bacterium]|nr:hypothetical protein [Chloroflexota bacterium]